MADILVTSPFQPFTLPTQFKAVFNGYVYCGTVDAVDPSVSPVQVYLINESGDKVPVAQPIRTNAGGYLVYNGQPAKFVTDTNHSLLAQDQNLVQVWYAPNMENFDPQSLSGQDGSSLIGFIHEGPSAVPRTSQDKMRETASVRDYGGVVDGITDDTAAIAAARAQVSDVGGTVVANGKAYSPGFWENLLPRAMEWVYGADTDYKTDTKSSKPLIWVKQFIGAPVTLVGYDHYGAAFDSYTKSGIDVQSGATAIFRMASYSNNSEGANFNKTNQVALVASANSLLATSSASVEAVNGIATSAYTGSLAQMVIGFEADLNAARAPGFFGEASSTYSVGFSSNWTGGSFDGTVAYAAGTSNASKTWLHGLISSGTRNTGVTVTRNGAMRPTTGVWVAAASSHGVYIGAKSLNPMNPGQGGDYTYKPSIGIALGQEGDTSAPSHKLRFTSTDAGGVEQNCDMQLGTDSLLSFAINGVSNRFGIGPTGTVYVQNTAVVGTRKTGYTAFTGTVNRGTVYDVSTITLQQLAARVAAIQADLASHGLIGA